MDGKKNYLSIGEASEYLGVSIDTLRRWEKKGRINPYRSPGGHRYYEKDELDRLFGKRYARDESSETKEDVITPVVVEAVSINPVQEFTEVPSQPHFTVQPPRPFPQPEPIITPPPVEALTIPPLPEPIPIPPAQAIPLPPVTEEITETIPVKPVVTVVQEVQPIAESMHAVEATPIAIPTPAPQPVAVIPAPTPAQKEIRIPTFEPIRIERRQEVPEPPTPAAPPVSPVPMPQVSVIEHKPEPAPIMQTQSVAQEIKIPEIKPAAKIEPQPATPPPPKQEVHEHKPLLNPPGTGILVPQPPRQEATQPVQEPAYVKKEKKPIDKKEMTQVIVIVAVLALVTILGIILFVMLWSSSQTVLSPSP